MSRVTPIDPHEILESLSLSDERAGTLDGLQDYLKKTLEIVKSKMALRCKDKNGGSFAEANARALVSPEYQKALDDFHDAKTDALILSNERNTLDMKFKCWQAENANRRQAGNTQ